MGSLDARPLPAAPDPAASPCNQVCTLDADDVCIGCGRTLDEIAAWGTMTAAERATTRAAAAARRRTA